MEVLGAGFLIVMFFRSVDHHKVSKQGKADVAAISGGTRPELVLSTTSSSAFFCPACLFHFNGTK